tara:strand:- start:1828 stop:2298 length:471 start_codon:yes stop_codon:yes gene_type:complete
MVKSISMLLTTLFLISCTSPPRTQKSESSVHNASEQKLSVQTAVAQCVTPHEAYTFPPQAIPGIPAILARHGECMGVTNVVVLIWPGEPSRLNLLYIKMLVESYLVYLEKNSEVFKANLISTGYVKIEDADTGLKSEAPTSAAVFKLEHVQQKEQK